MEEVVAFLEEEQHAVIRSCCLSPLGLCLVQFSSSLERQVMISRSPMQLDELREIEIVEHDRGINFRSCPFTRTCWIMFLAFPLDFQTREIITQAVGLFGSVITGSTMPDVALVLFSDARSPLLAESLEALSSVKEIPWVIKGTVGLCLFLF
jgi:hypothetical protein